MINGYTYDNYFFPKRKGSSVLFKEVKHTLENSAINPGDKLVRAKKKKKRDSQIFIWFQKARSGERV